LHVIKWQPLINPLPRLHQALDSRYLIRVEVKIKHFQIGSHVFGARCPGERQHANFQCESKDDLSRRLAMPVGDSREVRVGQHVAVRGQ
jgi:hypothetical protein